jgi:hypothetical protein
VSAGNMSELAQVIVSAGNMSELAQVIVSAGKMSELAQVIVCQLAISMTWHRSLCVS